MQIGIIYKGSETKEYMKLLDWTEVIPRVEEYIQLDKFLNEEDPKPAITKGSHIVGSIQWEVWNTYPTPVLRLYDIQEWALKNSISISHRRLGQYNEIQAK